jgi:hypothetical protein
MYPYIPVRCQLATRLERLGNGLVERLALDVGKLELECGRRARAVGAGEGARTPGRTTANLGEVGELSEGVLVAERHVFKFISTWTRRSQ